MLVSSFGYLNKSSHTAHGVRVENSKSQKPIVNQGLIADVKTEDVKTTDVSSKSECSRKLNVLA